MAEPGCAGRPPSSFTGRSLRPPRCRPRLGYAWHSPEWRNGRRSGLKLRGPQGRPSSNLGSGTNSGQPSLPTATGGQHADQPASRPRHRPHRKRPDLDGVVLRAGLGLRGKQCLQHPPDRWAGRDLPSVDPSRNGRHDGEVQSTEPGTLPLIALAGYVAIGRSWLFGRFHGRLAQGVRVRLVSASNGT